MFVRNVMIEDITTVTPDTTLEEAYHILKTKRYDSLPVASERDQLVGIVSQDDVYKAAEGTDSFRAALQLKVADVMTTRVVAVAPDDLIEQAASLMWEKDIPMLPVLDEGVLKGVITGADIFRAFAEMLGLHSGTVRLTLLVADRRGQLARISEIIRDAGVNITHVATFESRTFHQYKIMVRVEAIEVRPLVELLQQHSFRVIHISED